MYFIEMIFSLRFQEQYLNFLTGKCRKGINKIDMEIIFSNFHFDENGKVSTFKINQGGKQALFWVSRSSGLFQKGSIFCLVVIQKELKEKDSENKDVKSHKNYPERGLLAICFQVGTGITIWTNIKLFLSVRLFKNLL